MGYTHYWEFKNNTAPKNIEGGKEKFRHAVELFKECLNELNGKTLYPNWGNDAYTREVAMVLAGGNGKGQPTINDELVLFNGEDKDNNSHESFYISLDEAGQWDFCKTARKPYDTAVCLALLSFKAAFGDDFGFTSNGGEKEWAYAKSIFEKVKG